MEKRFLNLILIFVVLTSCSSEDVIDTKLTVCFEVDKMVAKVNEPVTITNCSKNAVSYLFEYDYKKTTTEKNPVLLFDNDGEKKVTLTVKNSKGEFLKKTINITVTNVKSSYIEVPSFLGDNFFPINSGVYNSKLYYIERHTNFASNSSKSVFNFVEFDLATKKITKKYIADKYYNASRAFVNFLENSTKNIVFSRTLSDRNGGKEVLLDATWNSLKNENFSYKAYYGFMKKSDQFLYYGSYRDKDYHNPTIEIRDKEGKFIERKIYNQIKQGFIGAMLKTSTGYIAFGGQTEPIDFSTFKNYKPIILFFNDKLEFLSHKTYDTELGEVVKTNNDLSGVFNLKKLNNSNYVAYSHSELRIISKEGKELKKVNFSGYYTSRIQSLIVVNDGFIITEDEFIRKYSNDGVELNSFKFKGDFTPNLIEYDNKIFFVSGYNTTEEVAGIGNLSLVKTFIGAVDENLNLINLN